MYDFKTVEPTSEQIAYCAGLFEGEGTIYCSSKYKVAITIIMCDLEPLNKLKNYVNMGNITGPYTKSNPLHSATYNYSIYKIKDVISFIDYIKPWLSSRRKEQIDKAMEKYYSVSHEGKGSVRREGSCAYF